MRTILTLAIVLITPTLVAAEPKDAVFFETHVRPILKAKCFECHGEGKKLRGGLDLRLKHLLAKGGDTGPGLVPGKPQASNVVFRVRKQEMPPGKVKLTAQEIAVLERWIGQGAAVVRAEPQGLPLGFSISPDEASHWAFQPIRLPALPSVKSTHRVRSPVDRFILARLEDKGLTLAPEADRVTLIRRASFDLLGLPPTLAEIDAFVKDTSPDAYEKLIDRLLASPQYGERWGRHWLDVAGYADSEGFTGEDPVRKTAYRYRDYVIRTFNTDMPWNRFIEEQLAGDEMVSPPYEKLPPAELDKLIATGFLRMAPDGTATPGIDVKAASNQHVADTLQIVSTSLLGLTIHCAQCHNHRYDPVPQVDYYHMRAIFEPALDVKNWRVPAGREVVLFKDEDRKRADAIEQEAGKIDKQRLEKQAEYIEATFQKQLAKTPKELHESLRTAHKTPEAKRSPEQKKLILAHPSVNVTAGSLYLYDNKAAADLKSYVEKATKLRETKPAPEFVRALTELPGQVPTTFLFDRGDHEQPTKAITPGGLVIFEPLKLGSIPDKTPGLRSTGRRLAFAKSLTSGRHPLVARALVNRFWLHHFGKGIVNTPGDLGILGERPSHPELLDYLASDFMAGEWRLKRLHKIIMTSAVYRQNSARRPELEKLDPDNRLLGRMSIRRLESEALRDAILAVSGKLDGRRFGPPVPVTHDEIGQVVIGNDIRISDGTPQGTVKSLGGEEYRRSVYVQVRRSLPLAVLETFDAPMMSPNCSSRNASTVSTQSLMLLNSRFIHDQAAFLAGRARSEAGPEPRNQVAHAWKLAYAQDPSPSELEQAVAFVSKQAEMFRQQKPAPAPNQKTASSPPDPALRAMTNLCQALMSANRFLYVD